ncbi:MAG: imidazole glycerol phosphate synthase subunit HisH [Gammaproteobacteria bacterium]|nr:imidazole glycerol phosphate synthase subunit HisH [Gammaproteobacteria bacterium]MCW9031600.1 imidazole glycerol phosphate synthase subunit HisH [Gammaproteobacteria bacterium]
MSSVAVIDYGMGNLHSVAKALEKVGEGVEVNVTSDARTILSSDRVVLPGVGAMRDCMGEIKRLGLDKTIHEFIESGKPLFGVCVGMQVLLESSAENNGVTCLGILPGKVEYFGDELRDMKSGDRLKIPHMGWNQVHQEIEHPMWDGIAQDARFYFVHSYYAQPAHPDLIAASTNYGFQFTSAVTKDNVFAVQFHPEKSQHAGLALYANFLKWNGKAITRNHPF